MIVAGIYKTKRGGLCMLTDRPVMEIFCSYADKDEPLRQQLEQHLSLLSRQGMVTFWHKRRIAPGVNCSQEIDSHLETASLLLLLVSADFLASDYCYGIEMQRVLQRHESEEACVIPILLRSCDWQNAPFASLQILPTTGKPITRWRDRDAAWTDVVTCIRRALDERLKLDTALPQPSGPTYWNVPFARNPFFTGRETLLAELHTRFQNDQANALSQPQAMNGLGGIGKTQVAIEYAYLHARHYQAVLWAQADSIEAIVSSYMTIATLLRLPERDAKEQEVTIQAVKIWLQTHRDWLFVLDNADELNLLSPFLPPCDSDCTASYSAGNRDVATRTGSRVSPPSCRATCPGRLPFSGCSPGAHTGHADYPRTWCFATGVRPGWRLS
jgi:hypothetical protein